MYQEIIDNYRELAAEIVATAVTDYKRYKRKLLSKNKDKEEKALDMIKSVLGENSSLYKKQLDVVNEIHTYEAYTNKEARFFKTKYCANLLSGIGSKMTGEEILEAVNNQLVMELEGKIKPVRRHRKVKGVSDK
jgi:hypothetical protein